MISERLLEENFGVNMVKVLRKISAQSRISRVILTNSRSVATTTVSNARTGTAR